MRSLIAPLVESFLHRIEVESIAASASNRERYVQWVMMSVRMNIPCVYGETLDILTLT